MPDSHTLVAGMHRMTLGSSDLDRPPTMGEGEIVTKVWASNIPVNTILHTRSFASPCTNAC